MGFFSAPKVLGSCFVCGDAVSYGNGFALTDGTYICNSCAAQKQLKVNVKSDDSKALILRMKENGFVTPEEFCPTKKVKQLNILFGNAVSSFESFIEFDEKRELMNIPELKSNVFSKDERHEHFRKFKDLIDFQLLSDGSSVADGNSLLGAAIGGATFGGFGAVVGAGARSRKINSVCNSLAIKVVFNDLENPEEIIELITTPVKTNTTGYKDVYAAGQKILSILSVILKKNRDAAEASKQPASTASSSVADEIKKFKELLDMGAITEEEFNAKKKQLLGL